MELKKIILAAAFLIPSVASANPLIRMKQAIEAEGIPVESVSTKNGVSVYFKPEATKAQRDRGIEIMQGFDLTPRPRPTNAQIVTKWNSLTAAQRNAALAKIIANLIENNPRLLAELGYEAD